MKIKDKNIINNSKNSINLDNGNKINLGDEKYIFNNNKKNELINNLNNIDSDNISNKDDNDNNISISSNTDEECDNVEDIINNILQDKKI